MVDDGRYGLDATFRGASGYERAEYHQTMLNHDGVPHTFVQELDGGWTLRVERRSTPAALTMCPPIHARQTQPQDRPASRPGPARRRRPSSHAVHCHETSQSPPTHPLPERARSHHRPKHPCHAAVEISITSSTHAFHPGSPPGKSTPRLSTDRSWSSQHRVTREGSPNAVDGLATRVVPSRLSDRVRDDQCDERRARADRQAV